MGTTESFKVTVYGHPEPGGSKKGYVNRKTGGVIITDANAKVKSWREEVARVALEACGGEPLLLDGALYLAVHFYLTRPKGHYGTGRNAHILKESAPLYPTVKPDATKLLRAVEDALSGVAYTDDSRIVLQTAAKHYGQPERCEISVTSMTGDA